MVEGTEKNVWSSIRRNKLFSPTFPATRVVVPNEDRPDRSQRPDDDECLELFWFIFKTYFETWHVVRFPSFMRLYNVDNTVCAASGVLSVWAAMFGGIFLGVFAMQKGSRSIVGNGMPAIGFGRAEIVWPLAISKWRGLDVCGIKPVPIS